MGVTVCWVRHAETAWTISGQHTGVTELALTPHGEQQARGLSARLRCWSFNQVLVSPRWRARQTCELAGFGATIPVDADLAEWDYGEYEGRRSVDIRRERPGWDIWQQGCPGGESPAQVGARIDRLIARLLTMEGHVALFSHGQLGAAFAARWLGLALREGQHFPLGIASVSLLGTDPHHRQRRTLNLWNHAPEPQPDWAGSPRG